MIMWLVIRVNEISPTKYNWEIIGLFSSEGEAVKNCKMTNDFIGPLEVDKLYPDETVEWPGAYYPLAL